MVEQDTVEVCQEKHESPSPVGDNAVEETVPETLDRWEGYSLDMLSAFLDQC